MSEPSAALDVLLAGMVVALAAYSVSARDTFAAIVAFFAYGLVLAFAWLRLAAPDVALTEAAIGSGLTSVLLLGTALRVRTGEADAEAERPGVILRAVAALLCAAFTAALAACVLAASGSAPTLAPEALANLGRTGLDNPVTAVLMAYRATDTLLEKVVLVLAVVGVWSLAPDRLWGGRPGPRQRVDSDGVLAFFARVLPPFGVVAGIYLLWISSVEAGGAFQGGTLLAAMWLLVLLAGLADAPPTSRRSLRFAVLAGPAVFLAVGLSGFVLADAFLAYPDAHAKALILLIEFPMLLSIAVMLGLLVLGPPQRIGDDA